MRVVRRPIALPPDRDFGRQTADIDAQRFEPGRAAGRQRQGEALQAPRAGAVGREQDIVEGGEISAGRPSASAAGVAYSVRAGSPEAIASAPPATAAANGEPAASAAASRSSMAFGA